MDIYVHYLDINVLFVWVSAWGGVQYVCLGSISSSGPAITAKREYQEAGENFMLIGFKSFRVHQLLLLR
jgi:hypothetical protein